MWIHNSPFVSLAGRKPQELFHLISTSLEDAKVAHIWLDL